MEPLWNWGNQIIVSIQAVHDPVLDGFFNAITFLGETEFFLLFFPFLLWAVDKSTGQRAAFLTLAGLSINTWAKELIGHPRPFEWPSTATSPVLDLNNNARGHGLPSGHTQSALMLWFYLAYHFKRPWLWILAAILFILISFSRVYLGVHFPTDLVGGAVLGLILLLLFIKFEDTIATALTAPPVWLQVGLAIIIPLLLILVFPHRDIVTAVSALSGFGLGIIFDRRAVNFTAGGSVQQRALRYITGMGVLLILYAGMRYLQPEPGQLLDIPVRIARYTMAGLWVGGGAGWFFKQVKLA